MTKIFTIEVVNESRALVTLEAENIAEAQEKITTQVKDGTIAWAMKDNLAFEVMGSKEKK